VRLFGYLKRNNCEQVSAEPLIQFFIQVFFALVTVCGYGGAAAVHCVRAVRIQLQYVLWACIRRGTTNSRSSPLQPPPPCCTDTPTSISRLRGKHSKLCPFIIRHPNGQLSTTVFPWRNF